jgi:hypothetical protein
LHPTLVKKIITNNGGHRPVGVVYPAEHYRSTLKNYYQYYEGITKIKFLKNNENFEDAKPSVDTFMLKQISPALLQIAYLNESKILTVIELNPKDLKFYQTAMFEESKTLNIKDHLKLINELVTKCPGATAPKFNHVIEDFSKEHILTEHLTTESFQHKKNKQALINIFLAKIDILQFAIREFKKELETIVKNSDIAAAASAILSAKIETAQYQLLNLSRIEDQYTDSKIINHNYLPLKENAQNKLKDCLDEVGKLEFFSQEQLKIFQKSKFITIIKDSRIAFRGVIKNLGIHPGELINPEVTSKIYQKK